MVQIGEVDEEDKKHEENLRRTSAAGGLEDSPSTPAAISGIGHPEKLVRVCSWSDRRESGVGNADRTGPNGSAPELVDDVHMPSVKELAKQFSFNVSSRITKIL